MASRRSLKVFETRLGFHDWVVAAPSQAAALRAWGVHQDLFAEGQAWPADNPAAVAAALARPEIPLRRAVGSSEPFAADSTSLPKLPAAPRSAAAPRQPREPKPKPPPDRRRLDAAEATLRGLAARRAGEEADLARRRVAQEAEVAKARRRHDAARRAAAAELATARSLYDDAGGDV